MKQFKGTKGMWKIKAPKIYSSRKRTEVYTDTTERVKITSPVFEILHNEESLIESNYNAQLISAAPELLEALQQIVGRKDVIIADMNFAREGNGDELEYLFEEGQEAINKALGK